MRNTPPVLPVYTVPRYTVAGVVQTQQDGQWREHAVRVTGIKAVTPAAAATAALAFYANCDLARWYNPPQVTPERI